MAADKPAHPPLWRQSSFVGVFFFFFLPWEVKGKPSLCRGGGETTIFEGLAGSLSLERQ